jgi:apolipoprotein N-acyltransferase
VTRNDEHNKKMKQNYFLALLSAFLMWLAWPPHIWLAPLLLIGLVPLFIALNNITLQAHPKKGRKIFYAAGLTFLVWNTASIYWVYNAISADNNVIVAFLISLIPFGLGALLMTFAFWLYFQLKSRVNTKIAYVGLISFYIAMEYLHQTWDLSFPWMTLGNGFAGMHQLVQWYEFTGVYGGSLWILLSNILAFEAYQSFKSSHKLKYQIAIFWALLVVLPIGYSVYTYSNYKEKSVPINVVTVQPNIDPYQKFSSISVTDQFNILTRLSDSVAQVNTEYFIWPETALPLYENEDRIRENTIFLAAQNFLNKYKNGSLITGLESRKFYQTKQTISAHYSEENNFYWDNFNAAMQVENSGKVEFYHKSKLVPGVEKMPFPQTLAFLGPVFETLGGSSSGWGWQENPGVFYSQNGVGVAPVICYESIWGDWVGESVKNGAQFIAVITNDGWWGNTSGKDQHLMYAKLRAIETRRWVVRSANTGISGFINQRGDIVKQSKWWTANALKEDINLNDAITPYVNSGDLIAKLFSVLAVLLALIIPYKKWIQK